MAKWMNEFVRMAVCSVDNPDFLVEAGCSIHPRTPIAWPGFSHLGPIQVTPTAALREVLGTLANVTLDEAGVPTGLWLRSSFMGNQ